MQGEYERLRDLLLDVERERLQGVERDVRRLDRAVDGIPDALVEQMRQRGPDGSETRFARTLSELTASSLEVAVRRRPQVVADAVYPVMGPAIRRAIGQSMRQMAEDFDTVVRQTLSLRALKWRIEAWRAGVPYSQVVLRHTTRYQVEHLLLIDPSSGLLFGHVSAAGLPALHADAVAGMFTAISHFVRDSVAMPDADARFEGARIGDYQLLASHGSRAWTVAFVRGVAPSGLATRLDMLTEDLHARHAMGFEDGARADDLQRADLDELNQQQDRVAAQPSRRWPAILVLVLLGVLLLGLAWRHIAWSRDASEIERQVATHDGLVVTRASKEGHHRYRIDGLLDVGAQDPRPTFAAAFPQVDFDWRLQPYLSLAPDRVRERVARALSLPVAAIGAPDADGRVALSGEVPYAQWHRARHAPPLAGVHALDVSALQYPDRARIDALVARIRDVRIGFDRGMATPSPASFADIETLKTTLDALQSIAAPHGIALDIEAHGFTDEPGSFGFNRDLRERRAEWLATVLMERLQAPSTVRVDPSESATLPYRGNERSAFLGIETFPAEDAR